MFKGSYVALVTPFKNGKVDAARLKWLVDYQIEHGTDGLVPCGSTGEICSNMMVDGGRPTKPEFTITDSKGKEVQKGSFEYG